MIEWMQTHKKWLIITIWVATISFILAGAVGWGTLTFGRKADTIAKVGETEIETGDVQQAYQLLFDLVNAQMGGKLDDATATKLGLKRTALTLAIQDGYFRELARRLGLKVTDQELAAVLQKRFKTERIYNLYLNRIGMTKRDYENLLRHQLVVQKLLGFLRLKPSKLEVEAYGAALYMADKLKIKILDGKELNVTISPTEVEQFYKQNQQKFMTQPLFKIEVVKIPLVGEVNETVLKEYYDSHTQDYLDENGTIIPFDRAKEQVKLDYLASKLKRKAFLSYRQLKEGKINGEFIELPFNNNEFTQPQMEQLKERGYLRPTRIGRDWVIAKLIKVEPPKPKPLSQVEGEIRELLLRQKRLQLLLKEGESMAKGEFNGTDIGYHTRFDTNITGLSEGEAGRLLGYIFSNWNRSGAVAVSDQKVVVYRIEAQKLLDRQEFEENRENVAKLVTDLLNKELRSELLNYLAQIYPAVSYIKDGN